MAGSPEWNEEYSQTLLEKQIREQCELHGWATISTANPMDILILEEEEGVDYNIKPKKRAIS
jgi:hypothetical protein